MALRARHVLATLSLLALPAGAVGWACGGNPASGNDGGVESGSGSGSSGSGSGSSSSSSGGDMPAECTVDGGAEPVASVPVSGSFTGTDLAGYVCAGGAFAYLEKTPNTSVAASQLLLIIDSSFSGNPATMLQFQMPAGVTSGDLTILAGVSAATPGTYGSANGACGGVVLCAELALPPGLDCGDASSDCPPGCALEGPVSGPTCMPEAPETCYEAQAASDCVDGTQTVEGSWTATLTSVEPYDAEGGASLDRYVVHGSFTTTMVGGDDAGAGSGSMTLRF